jgi:hypothetical protein
MQAALIVGVSTFILGVRRIHRRRCIGMNLRRVKKTREFHLSEVLP